MTRFRMPSRRRTGPVALAAGALFLTAGLAPTANAADPARAAFAWGYNNTGQLGTNTPVAAHTLPTAVAGLPTGVNVLDVAAGEGHSLALLADGTVWAWGSERLLGSSATTGPHSAMAVTPVKRWRA